MVRRTRERALEDEPRMNGTAMRSRLASIGGRQLLTAPALRYLGLLLLLTPLLGGMRMLAMRDVSPPPPEVITVEVERPVLVEVDRPVYVPVPVVLEVPVEPPAEGRPDELAAALPPESTEPETTEESTATEEQPTPEAGQTLESDESPAPPTETILASVPQWVSGAPVAAAEPETAASLSSWVEHSDEAQAAEEAEPTGDDHLVAHEVAEESTAPEPAPEDPGPGDDGGGVELAALGASASNEPEPTPVDREKIANEDRVQKERDDRDRNKSDDNGNDNRNRDDDERESSAKQESSSKKKQESQSSRRRNNDKDDDDD